MQNTTTMRAGRLPRARRGFTLVEVLIALVLLLIGVYAMFAIFPRGYAAMEASQFRTIASQLAESELARWKLMPESLPDQIVATDYNGQLIPGTLVARRGAHLDPDSAANMLLVWNRGALPLPDSTQYHPANLPGDMFYRLDRLPGALYSPEDLTPCSYDGVLGYLVPTATQRGARPHPNWQPDSLYLARTTIGEQIDIMRLPGQVAGVPFYLLSHAPLDLLRGHSGSPASQVWMDIYDSRPWQYRGWDPVWDANGPTLAVREFAYDPRTAKLYVGPLTAGTPAGGALPRTFKLDYTGVVNTYPTRIYGVVVTTGQGGNNNGVTDLAIPPVTPSAMRVYEQLHLLTDQEYADIQAFHMIWPRNAYHIDASTAVTGKIEFCPFLQTNPRAEDITLVKMDYRVRDWQILVFDVEVPTGGIVRLPISHLKGPNSVNPPRQPRLQEVARGIRAFYQADGTPVPRSASDAASWAFVVAVDRQNGDVLTDINQSELMPDPVTRKPTTLPSNAYDRRTRVQVDFRGGVLHFNYDPRIVPSGTYDANVDTPNRSGRTYRVFCRAEADWAVQLLPSARLYARSSTAFPDGAPLTYSWVATKNPRQIFFPLSESGQTVTVDYYRKSDGAFIEGELHTIGGPQVVDLGAWVCGLSEVLAFEPNEMGPVIVRGVSVRARTVWVNRGRRSSLEDVAKAAELGAPLPPTKSLEETWRQIIVTTFIPRTPI